MEQKHLSKWLKMILIGMAICGLIIYAFVLPMYGLSLRSLYPEFSNRFWPWLIFLLLSGIPCFVVLVFIWKIADNIGNDRSFSNQNASLLKGISILAAADSAFFFVGNVVLLLLSMSHPGVVLASFAVEFIGVAIAVAAAALSHLVKKAAALQEQSDLTI
ncbi:MAG: DUF2975 domain-containing protein [Clostridia bacterium]|nr:DUF2975 domain-containing protein [Clostridia bacterium]